MANIYLDEFGNQLAGDQIRGNFQFVPGRGYMRVPERSQMPQNPVGLQQQGVQGGFRRNEFTASNANKSLPSEVIPSSQPTGLVPQPTSGGIDARFPLQPSGGGVGGATGFLPRPGGQPSIPTAMRPANLNRELSPAQTQLLEEKKWELGQGSRPSDFAFQLHAATRQMSDEDRTQYLASFRDRLANRLQRYEWRLTRGVGLTAEQKKLYDKLMEQIQTISELMESPADMTGYMEGAGRRIGQEIGVNY